MRDVISICWVSEVHHSAQRGSTPPGQINQQSPNSLHPGITSCHTSHVTRDMSHGDAPWEHSGDPGQWDLGHCQPLGLTTQCTAAPLPTSAALMQLIITAGFVFYGQKVGTAGKGKTRQVKF